MNNLILKGKNIVFVLSSFECGGAENQVLQLARYFKESEYCHVQIIASGRPAKISDLCNKYNVPWKSVSYPWSKFRILRYIRLKIFGSAIRKLKPDILISYTTVPNICCALTWQATGAQLCIWNQRDVVDGVIDSSIERAALRNVPLIISNSLNGKNYLVNKFGIPSEKIEVIRNIVQLKKMKLNRNQWRNHLGINESDLIVCMVANLSQYKDHTTLLHAWSLVVNKFTDETKPQITLVLAGRYDERYTFLVKLADDLNIRNYVKFLGPVDDITGLLSASDIGVFDSFSEGSPNALLEYMASGLPIIASDIPSIREIIPDSQIQFLYPPQDSSKFAELIIQLINDPDLRLELGRENIAYIHENFDSEKCKESYRDLIGKNFR